METTTVNSQVQKLKETATTQTEFVHGLLIFLLMQAQALDDTIENYGNNELKEHAEPFRNAIPEFIMVISNEIVNIHKNNNVLS